jgi:hypothetical protein
LVFLLLITKSTLEPGADKLLVCINHKDLFVTRGGAVVANLHHNSVWTMENDLSDAFIVLGNIDLNDLSLKFVVLHLFAELAGSENLAVGHFELQRSYLSS